MAIPEVLIPLVSFVSAWGFLQLCYPFLLKILMTREMLRPNYLGRLIPISAGILIPFPHLVFLPWSLIRERQMFLLQTLALFMMAYVGWRDDRWGGMEAKGLKGHILYLMRNKKISTGLWKAFIGSFIALTLSCLVSTSVPNFILDFLLIVFMTNLINLLDLRPGRAIKVFFLLFFLLLIVSFRSFPSFYWLPVIASVLFLFPDDMKANVMLGDAGANCLGMALGIWMVWFAPLWYQTSMLCFAIGVHLYAETKSISILIQKNPLLAWFDQLGRY